MTVKVEIKSNIPVVALEGRFDAYEVPELEGWLEENVANHTYVIIDFHAVTFIDTRALSTLVKWMKKLREKGGDLNLVQFSNPVRIIFELSRLDKAFSIYESLENALADCEGESSPAVNYDDTSDEISAEITSVDTKNATVMTLSERVDAFSITELQEQYDHMITEEKPFAIIDLSTVNFLDSAALAWLVKILKRSQAVHGDLVLIRSQLDVANRIFQLTQFDKVFKFADTVDEAYSLFE